MTDKPPPTTQSGDEDRLSAGFDQSVWVVIPAFNEEPRIAQVLAQVCEQGCTTVVVDDGSVDNTVTLAAEFPVWVLRHPVNCGQGAALKTGIDFAVARGADIIVTFDADGQHEADEIPRLIAPLLQGLVDVTLGSRFLGTADNIPWSRRLLLKVAVWFTRLTSGLNLSDAHNGFRAFTRHAAIAIRMLQPRMAHASEIVQEIARLKLRYREVPVTVTYRTETLVKGQSSWGALRITGHLLAGRFWK